MQHFAALFGTTDSASGDALRIECDPNNSEQCAVYHLPAQQSSAAPQTARIYLHNNGAVPSLTLYQAQKMAILSAMFCRVTLLQGPPGTGKTTVTCSIIRNLYLNCCRPYGMLDGACCRVCNCC
jgi:hypothetical protein